MRNNTYPTKLILISLTFIGCFIPFTFQQAPQQLHTNPVPSTEQNQAIQFKGESSSPPQIEFKQIHYSYNPEIEEEYSIVKTLIYPQVSGGGKFVSSMPKDSFVIKLTKQNLPIQPNSDIKQDPSFAQIKEKSEKEKQVEIKAEDILKKQTIEQEAKLAEEKKSEEKILKDSQKTTPMTPEKPDLTKSQPSGPKVNKKSEQKPAQKPEMQQKLFSEKESKKHPQIEKTDKKIKFKEHEIAKPLPISNYPFENKGKSEQKKQKSQQSKKNPVQQVDNSPKPKQSHPQSEFKKPISSQKKPNSQSDQAKKEIVKSKQSMDVKKQIIVDDKKKSEPHSKPTNPSTPTKQKSFHPSLDPQMIDEFNRITKSLSVDSSQLKTSLRFESLVKEQIEQSDWKLLIVKIMIWTTILIAIYQATCSSQSQEKKIEKGKYSPLGLTELQTQNSLQMSERADQR